MQISQDVSSVINRLKWRRMWLIFILYSILSIFFIAYIFVMQILSKPDYFITLIAFIAIIILVPISLLGIFALRSQKRAIEALLKGSGIKADERSEEEYSKIQSMNVLADEIRSKTARIQELEKEVEKLSLKILKPKPGDLIKDVPRETLFKETASEAQKESTTEETIAEERRHFPRTDEIIEISFKDTESFIKAYIKNVGSGGLFIKTEEPIELNEYIFIRFYLPQDKEPITAEGKVVWVTPKGVKNPSYPAGLGLKFIYIKPDDQKRLDDFVSQVIS